MSKRCWIDVSPAVEKGNKEVREGKRKGRKKVKREEIESV